MLHELVVALQGYPGIIFSEKVPVLVFTIVSFTCDISNYAKFCGVYFFKFRIVYSINIL